MIAEYRLFSTYMDRTGSDRTIERSTYACELGLFFGLLSIPLDLSVDFFPYPIQSDPILSI